MKKKILFLLSLAVMFTVKAADRDYYQAILNAEIDTFKMGYTDTTAFKRVLVNLSELEKAVISEPKISGKDAFLNDIQSVYAFIGELSPDSKNYNLLLTQKKRAMELLGVTDTIVRDSSFCLPVSKITLWNNNENTYLCYMVDNKSDSMMYLYKFDYTILRKFSSRAGSIDGAVSKKTSRALYGDFVNGDVRFKQTKCDKQLQVVTYIKQEAIMPKVEKYPEPNYLTPEQQKVKKQKEAEKAKKEAQKAKEKAKKEKEKEKREAQKAKEQEKREQDKAKGKSSSSKSSSSSNNSGYSNPQ